MAETEPLDHAVTSNESAVTARYEISSGTLVWTGRGATDQRTMVPNGPWPWLDDPECSAAHAVVQHLQEHLGDGGRTGIVWASQTAGALQYTAVLSRAHTERVRAVAGMGPISGANAITAVIATKLRFTGPAMAAYGVTPERAERMAVEHLRAGRAEVMIVGGSHRVRDAVEVYAGAYVRASS